MERNNIFFFFLKNTFFLFLSSLFPPLTCQTPYSHSHQSTWSRSLHRYRSLPPIQICKHPDTHTQTTHNSSNIIVDPNSNCLLSVYQTMFMYCFFQYVAVLFYKKYCRNLLHLLYFSLFWLPFWCAFEGFNINTCTLKPRCCSTPYFVKVIYQCLKRSLKKKKAHEHTATQHHSVMFNSFF